MKSACPGWNVAVQHALLDADTDGKKQRPAMRMYSPEELDVMAEAFDRALEKAPTRDILDGCHATAGPGNRLGRRQRNSRRGRAGEHRPRTDEHRRNASHLRWALKRSRRKRFEAGTKLDAHRGRRPETAHKCRRDVAGPYRPGPSRRTIARWAMVRLRDYRQGRRRGAAPITSNWPRTHTMA